MDPAARYQDEALVVLTVADQAGHGQHVPETGPVERRVLLSSSNPSIKIGRTSKRKAELEPVKGNCYFDCPVMSRDHAMLHLDAELQRVLIKDTESLHGTFVNGLPVESDEGQQIKKGDLLTFGMAVDRGPTKFYPFHVQADVIFGTESKSQPEAVTFRVPDESEVEDISSDESFVDKMVYARRVLRANHIRPAPAIDLTIHDEEQHTSLSNGRQPKDADEDMVVESSSRQNFFVDLTQSLDDDTIGPPRETFADENSQVKEPTIEAIVAADFDDFEDEFGDGFRDEEDDDEEEEEDEDDYEDDWAENESLGDVSISSGSPSNSEHLPNVPAPAASYGEPEVPELESHKLFEDAGEGTAEDADFFNMDTAALAAEFSPASRENEIQNNKPQCLTPETTNVVQEQNALSAPAQDGATSLGLKTGKVEYFQAREENKKKANATSKYESTYAEVELLPPFDDYPANPALGAPPLVASSLRFLNSPVPEVAPGPIPTNDDGLDESSAFNFEMSKKAIRGSQTYGMKDSNDAVQEKEAQCQATDTFATIQREKSLKRKADEISESPLGEEEGAAQDPATPDIPPIRQVRPNKVSRSSGPRCRVFRAAPRDGPRSPKRLRRAAEVFGYVALGGVAVMTALIATAPAL